VCLISSNTTGKVTVLRYPLYTTQMTEYPAKKSVPENPRERASTGSGGSAVYYAADAKAVEEAVKEAAEKAAKEAPFTATANKIAAKYAPIKSAASVKSAAKTAVKPTSSALSKHTGDHTALHKMHADGLTALVPRKLSTDTRSPAQRKKWNDNVKRKKQGLDGSVKKCRLTKAQAKSNRKVRSAAKWLRIKASNKAKVDKEKADTEADKGIN